MAKPQHPRLHVFTTADRRHGGFMSARTLIDRLRAHFHVTAWSVRGEMEDSNRVDLASAADAVRSGVPDEALTGNEHALFYMNDYPPLFQNRLGQWRRALERAGSVQIVFNRSLGSLACQAWLADVVTRIYFHDSWMRRSWQLFTNGSPLAQAPAEVLPPPAELSSFLDIPLDRPEPVVVGRMAGDVDVPRNAVGFYSRLAAALPEVQFWFMPPPPALANELAGHKRFRFFERDAIGPAAFLRSCHIFALTYGATVPVPGPRSLMEAMAAACAPVVIDRHGPRDRVVHGVSGFRSNNDNDFISHVVSLARDAGLRTRIGEAARARAADWGPEIWIERIVEHSIGSTAEDAERTECPGAPLRKQMDDAS